MLFRSTVLAASGVEVVSGGPALKTEVLRQAAQEPSGLADKGRLADEGQPAERFMQPPQRGGGGGGAPLAAAAGESAKKSDAALDAAADAGEAFVVDRESGAGREQIEVAGSSEAIAALIAALDAGRSNADADAELRIARSMALSQPL